jgi:hypothetical protein
VRSSTSRAGGALRAGIRPATALAAALLALLVAAAPVAAAEHYRSGAALREYDGGPKVGSAYLDRYFGGSPPGPTKTTVRVVMANVAAGTYLVQVVAGECFSEGYVLARLSAKTTSTVSGQPRLNRTLTLTSAQRRKVQQAYDAGSPVVVVVSRGEMSTCGRFGTPKLVP